MSSSEPLDREPAPSATGCDKRIEQLLLAGLDRYFAGEFEHAVQVWSRVFFLDRGHARARAYIERARGAIAERQREAEAKVYRADAWRTATVEPATDCAIGPHGGLRGEIVRDTAVLVRRDFPGAPAVARAVLADAEVASVREREPALAEGEAPIQWPRIVAQAMLVVLAAALLFTAGYVVAARDRLAAWWTVSSASEATPPAATSRPSAEPGGSGAARQQGSAAR